MAAAAAGITYRQLDYWARARLSEPSLRTVHHGKGVAHLYLATDVLLLKIVRRLLEAGVCLQQIRATTSALRDALVSDDAAPENAGAAARRESGLGDALAGLTLMSDGASVYRCTSADEVIELVQGGQGVFGIAVGRVWAEVEASLAAQPGEHPDGTPAGAPRVSTDGSGDELAVRRAARRTG